MCKAERDFSIVLFVKGPSRPKADEAVGKLVLNLIMGGLKTPGIKDCELIHCIYYLHFRHTIQNHWKTKFRQKLVYTSSPSE